MTNNGRSRIVITGYGMISPLALDADTTFDRMTRGESGIALIERMDMTGFPVKFGGEATGFDPIDYISKRYIRRLDRFAQLGVAATDQALKRAGIALKESGTGHKMPVDLDPTRIGVIYGSGVGGLEEMELQYKRYMEKGPLKINPFLIPKMMANAASGQISILFGLQGSNYCPVSACASGAHAIGEAMVTLQRGDADIIVAGGSEAPITALGMGGFYSLKAISTRTDDPQGASRPFDKDRDGFVCAEAGGTMILETLEHAQSRGAEILGEMVGYGNSADAYHLTEPAKGGVGCVQAMRSAQEFAGVSANEIDYINAHGTSTYYNDRTESAAIRQLFESHADKLVVSSTKSMTGHTLGAAGAVEAIVSLLAIRNGMIPPTINYTTPDPECDLNYCPNEAQKADLRLVQSNSLGFGGHNVSLIVKRFEN